MIEPFSKIVDVLFNGRPADPPPPKPKVTIEDLICRRTSTVRFRGKKYRITVTAVDEDL